MAESISVTSWDDKQAPTEDAMKRLLAAEGLNAYRWSNGPGDIYPAHSHGFHKVIYVVRGSIAFGLPKLNRTVTLQIGDRMDLPAGIQHDAVVGPDGVVCLEAHGDAR